MIGGTLSAAAAETEVGAIAGSARIASPAATAGRWRGISQWGDKDWGWVAVNPAADLPLRIEPIGGGGTDFRPALAVLADADEPPACIAYLTDLEGRFPDEPPPMPIISARLSGSRRRRLAHRSASSSCSRIDRADPAPGEIG
jgi:hypothetical protein